MLGAGLIGKRQIEAVQKSNRAQVVGVIDPTPAAKEFADQLSLNWFASFDDFLKTNSADGVVIATPNQMHVDNGLQCVAHNLPTLIEKPIADKADDAQRLVEAAKNAGVEILVGHHRRHNSIIKTAKQKIIEGEIGDIVAAHSSCWLYKQDDYFDVKWRTQKGAGPVLINLIHDVDLMRYLVDDISSVQAIKSNKTRGNEVADTTVILLQFENGALGTMSVSDTIVSPLSWELTAKENPAYPATKQNCYSIGGTHGTLEIPTGKIWSQDTKNGTERSWWNPIENEAYAVIDVDPLDEQIDHFCDVIEGKAKPIVSGEEGLKSLRVIEAIIQAAECGETVKL